MKIITQPKILIINSCGKKKAISHSNQPSCSELIREEQRNSQKERFEKILTPASELYTGNQALSIKNGVSLLRSKHHVDFFIISAGFGFVKEHELLPPYECSFSTLKKHEIKERARNLFIMKKIREYVTSNYDMIYIALGKEYFTAIENLDYIASKTPLLVHFNKKIAKKEPYYLVDDVFIVKTVPKLEQKIFLKPIGALITSKGTLLENYALDLQKNDKSISDLPFNIWIELKLQKLKSVKIN